MQLLQPFTPRTLIAGAALLLTLAPPAHAQYSWIDAAGARVFSDRPPPPGTPPARILKAPRAAALAPYGEAPAPAAAPLPAAPAKPAAPTLAERDAAFRARSAKTQEAESALARKAQQQASKEKYCKSLRRDEMALGAGTRLAEFDDKGERRYVADEERAGRLAELKRRQADECK